MGTTRTEMDLRAASRKGRYWLALWLALAAFAVYGGFLVLGWLGMAGAK